ncbi:MAG TPA: NADH-ubiquinone oxidoreductase-F iron-sulfur binding region domain-containing protein [Acidimicrobiales bacterium]|nr:NADH-ubiquinone oxidoreductase-F iron-sulfur binding region domain-containing protein [Acidimicrobiales bacterium]
MHSANAAPAECDRHSILGLPTDLAGHIATHGPLEVSLGSHASWDDALVASLELSGLAGRGGGGFPSAIKLALTRSAGRGGAIVVNGMEGEPASDKDKVLLTRVPHLVLDGAQYVAALCGASRIVVCVPEGRDVVAAAVHHALTERAEHRHATVREEIARPPDRFTAGEESALVNWLDTGMSLPVFRPDKGIPLRVGRRPVLVHNTETLAHLALIARHGPGPFRARGLPEEPGTCLVTIGGAVAQPGVVEVERGTPLQEIARRGRPVEPAQAFLVGGYGGAWIGPEHFETPYASMSLRTIGATAGVGVLVLLGTSACGVTESARIARYLAGQSAGQCGPCVFGVPAIADDMALLAQGRGDRELMRRLLRRLDEVNGRGACRHPDGAVGLVRSALKVFAVDVEDHRRGRPCAHYDKPSILPFPVRTPR